MPRAEPSNRQQEWTTSCRDFNPLGPEGAQSPLPIHLAPGSPLHFPQGIFFNAHNKNALVIVENGIMGLGVQ